MFESLNLHDLTKVLRSVITPEVVSEGKPWQLSDEQRHKVRLAMFGPGRPTSGDVSAEEQKELLRQFSTKVAGPLIEALPAHTAAWAVVMLYEEFVNAVFIGAVLEADVGGGD